MLKYIAVVWSLLVFSSLSLGAQTLPSVTDLMLHAQPLYDDAGDPNGYYRLQVGFTPPPLDTLTWHKVKVEIGSSALPGNQKVLIRQVSMKNDNQHQPNGVSLIWHGSRLFVDLGDYELPSSAGQTLTAEIKLQVRGSSLETTSSVSITLP